MKYQVSSLYGIIPIIIKKATTEKVKQKKKKILLIQYGSYYSDLKVNEVISLKKDYSNFHALLAVIYVNIKFKCTMFCRFI